MVNSGISKERGVEGEGGPLAHQGGPEPKDDTGPGNPVHGPDVKDNSMKDRNANDNNVNNNNVNNNNNNVNNNHNQFM
jgi:hypothetical protein